MLLRLAAGCYELTGLGYLGGDGGLEAVKGPRCLELNARAGLGTQIATGTGLAPYLRKIERDGDGKAPVETRVAYVEKYLADTPQN